MLPSKIELLQVDFGARSPYLLAPTPERVLALREFIANARKAAPKARLSITGLNKFEISNCKDLQDDCLQILPSKMSYLSDDDSGDGEGH